MDKGLRGSPVLIACCRYTSSVKIYSIDILTQLISSRRFGFAQSISVANRNAIVFIHLAGVDFAVCIGYKFSGKRTVSACERKLSARQPVAKRINLVKLKSAVICILNGFNTHLLLAAAIMCG